MIKTVKQACRFNPIIHDYRMSEGIENLADLIAEKGDGREFFSRNFVTHDNGWRTALKHALGDVAQSELLAPRVRRASRGGEDGRLSLDLFGDEA
jgi:hypothetical protein